MAKEKNNYSKRESEKDMADLSKFVRDQNFETTEELEAFLDQVVGQRIDEIIPKKRGRKSNSEKADDLIFEAYEAPTKKKAIKIAEKALKLDPKNVRSHILLAELEENGELALEKYEIAIELAKESLGQEQFEEMRGHFWGFHETRPYMEANGKYAERLYENGYPEDAIDVYQEMLALNPNDNQGIRYNLASHLVTHNLFKDYLELYDRYPDEGGALWKYVYAIYLFKKNPKSLKTTHALKKAYEANHYVLQILTGQLDMPEQLPDYYGIGDENEAVICVETMYHLLMKTKGSVNWFFKFYSKQMGVN